ncbi:unnamed protein product [Phaeothamnion confervicola]
MGTVAVGIFCKTPAPGHSKTRLSPPLRPEDCSAISACFIRDLAGTIDSLDGDVTPYAIYTPLGSELTLRALLAPSFELLPQCDGDFGTRLLQASEDLFRAGHSGAILVNSDSPTLPASILQAAVNGLQEADCVVLSPSFDGGYTLIGLSKSHSHLFADIPWSTSEVHRLTMQRAAEINLPVFNVPGWYDVDDAQTLELLKAEFAGTQLPFAAPGTEGARAPSTRQFLSRLTAPLNMRVQG